MRKQFGVAIIIIILIALFIDSTKENNAQRYCKLIDNYKIEYYDKDNDDFIFELNSKYKDTMYLVNSTPVTSADDVYQLNEYKSKDGSVLTVYTKDNICVSVECQNDKNTQ